MKNKILIYGDCNLNIIDGSSIWVISLVKLLSQDKNNIIDLLLKTEVQNDVLIKTIKKIDNVKILNSCDYIKKYKEVTSQNISKIIEKIDEYREYSCVVVRGFNVVKTLMKSKVNYKIIPYLTDFCHNKEEISKKEKQELKDIYLKVKCFFVQTKQMLNYLKEVLEVDGKKFYVLTPMVFKRKNVTNNIKYQKSIVYAGKFAKNWNILELIEIMDKLYKIDSEITLHVIGNKFNNDLADKQTKNYILKKLKNSPNIIYYGGLPREETMKIIEKCQLGYGFRSNKIDNNNSLELSTKLLEYCSCEIPTILRRTKMYEELLGENYQLFAENVDECVKCIASIFSDKKKYLEIQKKVCEKFKNYDVEKIYENIKDAIYSYPMKKLRLLISGHDLKFIKDLYPYFEKEYDLKIQELPEYMELNYKQSKKLLKSTDIVWCEWLLLNARWYSQNIYPHQKLFIRAHRFEKNKKYGYGVNYKNVTKVITVSYYYYEEFIKQFNIPRNKVTVISNYISTEKYIKEKNPNYKYNIAIIGALPARKGLDRAVDILIKLKTKDDRYKLYVPGKRPEEMANTWNVPQEKEYYLNVYKKIKENKLEKSVIFNGWIDIPEFLKDIGYVLSVSDSNEPESFHLAPLEGMASGSIGLATKWEGIEYIYPEYCQYDNIEEIAEAIINYTEHNDLYKELTNKSQQFIKNNYDIQRIWSIIFNNIDGEKNEKIIN